MKDTETGLRSSLPGSLCFLSLIFASLILPGWVLGKGAFTVTRSSERGMVIEFTLPRLEIGEEAIGGESYQVIRSGGISMDGRPGAPRLEMFTALIGIPAGAEVSGTFSAGRVEVLSGLHTPPVMPPGGDVPSGGPPEGQGQGMYPGRYLEVDEPGMLRRQRVVRLRVYPFQVNPATNEVRVVREGTIDLRFTGGGTVGTGETVSEEEFEGVYRKTLLNYDQAKQWRLGPAQRPVVAPSPFTEGEWWLKVIVSDEGIYRITYDDILQTGLDPAAIDPATFQLFYGGGKELPWSVMEPRPELQEVSIEVDDEEDGSFDPGDGIVFYGQSLLRWEQPDTYLRDRYESSNCYWLTWGNPDATPLRMAWRDGSPGGGGEPIEFYRGKKHVEQDNIYATEEFVYTQIVPDDWVWENIPSSPGAPVTRDYTFQLNDTFAGGEDSLRLEIYGQQGTGSHSVDVRLNGVSIRDISFTGAARHNTGWFLLPTDLLRGGGNTLSLVSSGDPIYMGWFEVNAVYSLENVGDEVIFNGQPGSGDFRFRLGGVAAGTPLLYEVGDPFRPSIVEGFSLVGSDLVFELPSDQYRQRFIFLDRGRMLRPSSVTVVDNMTLRSTANGADYLVITDPALEDVARDIAAYRAEHNGFLAMVVTSDRIYNEFSWGLRDVTAFRDFLKYAYESWSVPPQMVLFLGDGHYDYKGFTSAGRNKFNPLPPHINNDLVIEDWFVRLDSDQNPDMIYGRMPVRTVQEARNEYEKIRDYEESPEYGAWRSRAILAADDYYTAGRQCESLPHTEQSEEVDARLPKGMERVKVYLLDYPFDPPETGLEKPAATDDLLRDWNRGALLINFVGHGSYRTWAHEKLFHMPDDFPRLDNGARLPMIIAASCEIGRFDDPSFDSMVEDMLDTPGKGIIAAFSATRATFSGPNRTINNNLIEELFRDPFESPYIGEAALAAKIRTGGSNASRYTIFGDPAMRLAVPGSEVSFTDTPDSLRPLGIVSLSGEIRSNGSVEEGVNGFAEVRAFDSPVERVYDECPSSQSFMTSGNPLFNGVVRVDEGRFTVTFMVPANIPASLPPDTAAISDSRIYTYINWDGGDGYGGVDSIPISLVSSPVEDSVPPTVGVALNGRELASGDDVGVGQEILIEISDESGVNITGSPGHQIIVEIDGGTIREDITDDFRYDVDSFQSGSITYAIPAMAPGRHHFEFRASDNALNVAHMNIDLDVFAESEMSLSDVLIYPNPFTDNCVFTFEVNQPSKVTIKIYTVAGRLIRRIDADVGEGYNQIAWDGRDWRGDRPANGAYLCYVRARSFSGSAGKGKEDERLVKALLVR